MSDLTQIALLMVVTLLLHWVVKPYPLRKWLGLALMATGVIGCATVGEGKVLGFDLELLAIFATPVGLGFFLTRRRFAEES